MKRSYSCAMLAFLLLAALLSGCSSAVTEQQEDAQYTTLTTETAEQPSPTTAEDVFSESSWTVVREYKLTHPTYLVGFLNENFGITVGARSEIHYTADGGQTWPESENASEDLFCLDIVDENIAWCSGYSYHYIRMSNDGGKTWTAVNGCERMIYDHSNIDFIDDSTGWVTSLYWIAGTRDGGKTWTEISMPEGADGVAAICLRTRDIGYLLSRDGMLYVTADGGTTWSSQDLGFKNYDIINPQRQPKLNRSIPTSADISFADENKGVIVFTCLTSSHGYQTWCLTTGDGGASWKPELIPKTNFTPSKVFISDDGQYLTLSDSSGNAIVLKRK